MLVSPVFCREFIGRDDEFARLSACRRAAGEGHGAIVLIAGEPGIGKSRLLSEFRATLVHGRAATSFAQCVEFVQRPFAPLRDSLVQFGGAPASAPVDPFVQRLNERLFFDHAARDDESSVARLFEMIESAFVKLCERRTLVLFIEDLHWADRATLGFLAYAAERLHQRRMLVVASYRFDEVHGEHPNVAPFSTLLGKPNVSEIRLAPLETTAMQRLLAAACPDPHALRADRCADILRRSEGNPFVAEELLKVALLDGPHAPLPLSLRGSVLARLARLSGDERSMLSQAAVLGRRFSAARVARLLEKPASEVLSALQRARALQLIVEERDARDAFAFRHALTQEVVYAELLQEQVRPLHEQIGRELESLPDRDAAIFELAHHWWSAGDGERAAAYNEAAGVRAQSLLAFADAIGYYERALHQRGGDDFRAARLEHRIGVAFGSLGQAAAAIPPLRAAGDRWRKLGDFDSFARNAAALGAQMYHLGEVREAVAFLHGAVAEVRDRASTAAVDSLRARAAYSAAATLDFRSALETVDGIADIDADPTAATLARQVRLKAFAMGAELGRWRAEIEPALAAAARIADDDFLLRSTHSNVAIDATALGEAAIAREYFERAFDAQPGRSDFESLKLAASALEHVLRGDLDGAARLLERAETFPHDDYATGVHLRGAQLALGIADGNEERLDRNLSEDFLEYGIAHQMHLSVAVVGGVHVWALALRGRFDDAQKWLHRIVAVIGEAHRLGYTFLAAAQFGDARDLVVLRCVLARAAVRPHDRVNRALLPLFDAYASSRGLGGADVAACAAIAAERFEALGWPWFAARGRELAGETPRAIEVYRRIGALRDLRRLGRWESPAASRSLVLSRREREVAELVANAKSNEEIARTLGISKRTVENHVSAALEKLALHSRAQLGLYLR